MLKNKWLIMSAFALLSLCAMMFAGCTLEGNIESLREKVTGEQGGNTPNTPTSVTATALSSSSIRISWPAYPGTNVYYIYRSLSPSGGYELTNPGYSYTTSFTDTGLSANTTYYYTVDAMPDGFVNLGYASARTHPSGSGGGVPSAPTSVTASAASSSSITVSWNTVSGATNYYIYRSSSASGSYTYIGQSYSSTSYTDTGLSASTTYYYKVAAVNSNGTGSQSSYAYATTHSSYSGGDTIELPYNEMYFNTLTAGAVHQYRFYASSGSYYVYWKDTDNSSYTGDADIKVGVKREDSSSYLIDVTDDGNYEQNTHSFYVSSPGYYIIEVQGYNSSSSGTYEIGYW